MEFIFFFYELLLNPITLIVLFNVFLVGFLFTCLIEGIVNYFKKEKVNLKPKFLKVFLICVVIGGIIISAIFFYNFLTYEPIPTLQPIHEQELEAFNNKFYAYSRYQIGSNVKALCKRIIALEKNYEDSKEKIVSVVYYNEDEDDFSNVLYVKNSNNEINENYVEEIQNIYNKIDPKKEYLVECETDDTTKFVNKIYIVKVPEDVKDVEKKELNNYMENYINNIVKNYKD